MMHMPEAETFKMHDLPTGELNIVPFISVDNMMKLIHNVGVERFLAELTDYIEADFRRWPLFDKKPRIASHSDVGVIELMPTSDGETYGFKYVNGHPKNTRHGLQTVTAFGVLSNVGSGYPMLLTEMTMLTALRTAATSAMAARYLAPDGAQTMAMIGNGAQCAFQALAFKTIIGIEQVRLYDIDPAATEISVRNLARSGLKVVPCTSSEQAIEGDSDHHHLHRRQAERDHPDRQHGRQRCPHQRDRRRLPWQDGTASRHSSAL